MSRCQGQYAKSYKGKSHTVSTTQHENPFESVDVRYDVPGVRRESSNFAFFSSPPDAAMMMRPDEVTITKRCRFFVVLPPKKRENFRGASYSPPCFETGLWAAGDDRTTRLPSFKIRSLVLVKTGDHSMSSWLGGGSSVTSRGTTRELTLVLDAAGLALEA